MLLRGRRFLPEAGGGAASVPGFADVDKVADPSKYYLTGSGWQHHSPYATVLRRFMFSYGFMLHWGCPPDLLNGADVFARFLTPRSGSSDSAANDSSKRVPHPDGLVVAFMAHFFEVAESCERIHGSAGRLASTPLDGRELRMCSLGNRSVLRRPQVARDVQGHERR